MSRYVCQSREFFPVPFLLIEFWAFVIIFINRVGQARAAGREMLTVFWVLGKVGTV